MKKRDRHRRVKCRTHGESEGYVVCLHVADGHVSPAFVEHPGETHPTLGTILCAGCVHESGKGLRDGIGAESLVLVCGLCVAGRAINRVELPMLTRHAAGPLRGIL